MRVNTLPIQAPIIDAYPTDLIWLDATVDRLNDRYGLAGRSFISASQMVPMYVHPPFHELFRDDLGDLLVLRKTRGHETDTGEESTKHVLAHGYGILWQPMQFCKRFSVGQPQVPAISAAVAWHGTRLSKKPRRCSVSPAALLPLKIPLYPCKPNCGRLTAWITSQKSPYWKRR
jgi:hypothetical protein